MSAYEKFDVTATTIPRSRNVINDTHHPAQRLSVVPDRLRSFIGQRDGLEVPAETATRLLPRGRLLWRLE